VVHTDIIIGTTLLFFSRQNKREKKKERNSTAMKVLEKASSINRSYFLSERKQKERDDLEGGMKENIKASSAKEYYITVLRLGHRLVRDERMSTHLGLVARAFGADELILTGKEDDIAHSINKVVERWGGHFKVSFSQSWKKAIEEWKSSHNGLVIHLTMYGEELDNALALINEHFDKCSGSNRSLLVIVGAEKVPPEVYVISDFNVSVGHQPHSEIAALAVFLDRLYRGKELYSTFDEAKIRILPMTRKDFGGKNLRIKKRVEVVVSDESGI
jgi:tRNA (cytidine56-2'-O)-methyltransferase